MAELTICIAHKHTPANDAALRIALDCIVVNTHCDYQLLIDTTTPEDPYRVYNRLVEMATTPYCVLTNSDVFFAPGWDRAWVQYADEQTILSGILVECGAIGIDPGNIGRSFGMTPQSFDREAFEAYALEAPLPSGEGWYMPCLMPRQKFLDLGGFDLSQGDLFGVEPVDKWFWLAWKESGGHVMRVRSVAYHLQRWSCITEQTKGVRYT